MPQRRKKGVPVLLIAGGGAAAAGAALAAGAGGGSSGGSASTTLASTTMPGTTSSTTTLPTTTTQPAACRYTLSPAKQAFPADGGQGTCNVSTSDACGWTVTSTEDWITIQGGRSGVGSGSVRFSLKKNKGGARTGRIRPTGSGESGCEISQAAGSLALAPAPMTWTSSLEIEDGRGRLTLGGAAAVVARGRATGVSTIRDGDNLVQAELLAGRGGGTWRFDIAGARAGSLRPVAGAVLLLGTDSVVFRLEGRPGERVAFSYEAAGP